MAQSDGGKSTKFGCGMGVGWVWDGLCFFVFLNGFCFPNWFWFVGAGFLLGCVGWVVGPGWVQSRFRNWLLLTHLFSVQSLFHCEVGKAHHVHVACCRKRRVHIHRQKALGCSSLPHISECRSRKHLHLCTNMYSLSTDHAPHVTDTL